jgi:hypothetical protein
MSGLPPESSLSQGIPSSMDRPGPKLAISSTSLRLMVSRGPLSIIEEASDEVTRSLQCCSSLQFMFYRWCSHTSGKGCVLFAFCWHNSFPICKRQLLSPLSRFKVILSECGFLSVSIPNNSLRTVVAILQCDQHTHPIPYLGYLYSFENHLDLPSLPSTLLSSDGTWARPTGAFW